MKNYDVIIIGCGASGLMAGAQLKQRKKSFLIIDMGDAPARKVAISGGGRCNFTNSRADWSHYFGKNPRFVCSALAQWTPKDTLDWVRAHKIAVYEKEPGRYFCKNGADDIVNALLHDIGDTDIKYNTTVKDIEKIDDKFIIYTNQGEFSTNAIIIATGGMSYPHLGVSNIGHVIAKKFGHKIEPIRPALCAIKTKKFTTDLAGISLPVEIKINKKKIMDDLLFTHFGIGGPAVYRATLFGSQKITINFAPDVDVFEFLHNAKIKNGKRTASNVLGEVLPAKLARFLCDDTRRIADLRDIDLKQIATKVNNFEIDDASAIGMQSAEVTMGGISTNKISSKTMESQICNGLYFTGEVIDVTGDLGGYNIQWAFSSGFVAGLNA